MTAQAEIVSQDSTTIAAPVAGESLSAKIMIVDDEPLNVRTARRYLSLAGYEHFVTTSDSAQALALLGLEEPDIVLLDIMMPPPDGLEVLRQIRSIANFRQLPVIILTAVDDGAVKTEALNLGATDFLYKPVDPNELLPRVRNALMLKAYHDHLRDYAIRLEREVHERTSELEQSRIAIIRCLARAAEYRDNETGRHAIRVGCYAGLIARELKLPEEQARLIELAAPLHDVGKIAVSDSILLKPAKLTPEEFELMQKHCSIGKQIFEAMSHDEWQTYRNHPELGRDLMSVAHAPVLQLAASIALTHHERWDGTGYPLGLAGEHIPIEGRITAVADVFDALSSKRAYKPAFPLDRCFEILEEGRGTMFDPRILDAFFRRRDEVVAIQMTYVDVA
jgi:putative two-component system response regulator